MTTTTRTTRKAPWAAVLTALLAVVALVFGALAFAGVANAKDDKPNKPDNPGNSQNAPGHDDSALPPGQDDTVVPPGQVGKDEPTTDPKKVTICHFVEGQGEYGGWNIITMAKAAWAGHLEHHAGQDFELTAGKTCPPTVTPMSVCSGPPGALASTYTEVVYGPATGYQTTEAVKAAYDAAIARGWRAWTTGGQAACTDVIPGPTDTRCPDGSAIHAGDVIPEGFTVDNYCTVDTSQIEITPEQAAAIDAALAATVPATVAPVLPATVTSPEAVAVPAPATVPLPATVPAGDGSTVPQVPVALLALLALATAAAVTSGLRLATNR
jgi:hypothetical protein